MNPLAQETFPLLVQAVMWGGGAGTEEIHYRAARKVRTFTLQATAGPGLCR